MTAASSREGDHFDEIGAVTQTNCEATGIPG